MQCIGCEVHAHQVPEGVLVRFHVAGEVVGALLHISEQPLGSGHDLGHFAGGSRKKRSGTAGIRHGSRGDWASSGSACDAA